MASLICNACLLPCRAVSTVCRTLCNATSRLCSGSFCLYNITTLAFNIPPIAAGTMRLSHGLGGCEGSMWLLVNTCFCVINIGAAWYISARSQNPNDHELRGRATMIGRSMHLLCYDTGMALYILVLISFFCWLCVGVHWKASGRIHEGGECSDAIDGAIAKSIACGFSFFLVGSIALCCSLCAAGCDGRRFNDANFDELDTTASQEEDLIQEQNAYAPPFMEHSPTDVENLIPIAVPDDTILDQQENESQEQYSDATPLMGHLCTDAENSIPIATPVRGKTG